MYKELKGHVVTLMGEKGWKSWWATAKPALKREPRIGMSSGSQPHFRRLRQADSIGLQPQALGLQTHQLIVHTGAAQPHLIDEYKEMTGREAKADFPLWEDAHKNLMVKGGIPGIENVGGDIDKVTGKRCFFTMFPWRWTEGDGCVVRILAIVDQALKFTAGK